MAKEKVSKSTKQKVLDPRYPVAELTEILKVEDPRYPVAEQIRKSKSYGGSARKKMMGGGAMMSPRKQMAYGGEGRKKMKAGGKMIKGPCS